MNDLMKPRYIVIADYPGNDLKIGKTFEPNSDWTEMYLNKYPNIFRPLYWWEHREEKEMPEYVKPTEQGKLSGYSGVIKVLCFIEGNGIALNDWPNDTEDVSLFQPATETEWADYNKNK